MNTPPARGSEGLFLPAFFFPTVVCIAAGNNIILRNLSDIAYSTKTVMFFLGLWVLSGLMSVPAYRRMERSRACNLVARTLAAGGTFLLVSSSLSPILPAAADHWVLVAIAELVVLLMCVGFAASLPRQTFSAVFSTITAVLVVAGIGQHGYAVWRHAEANREREALAERFRQQVGGDASVGRGNVYHFLLDAFDGSLYTARVQENPSWSLPAFLHFTDFTSGYAWTAHSVPHLLGGQEIKDGDSLQKWSTRNLAEGFWTRLLATGVGVTLYTHYEQFTIPSVTSKLTTDFSADGSSPTPLESTADLWLLSLIPRSVDSYLRYGTAVFASSGDDGMLPPARELSPLSWLKGRRQSEGAIYDAGHLGAFSVLNYERLVAEEALRPPTGQYVFFHAILPHPPYVVDADCDYVGAQRGSEMDLYAAQGSCALQLVQRFVAELDAMGRLEDSLIIVHSDHGLGTEPTQRQVSAGQAFVDLAAVMAESRLSYDAETGLPASRSRWTDLSYVTSRSDALLLIRFPGETSGKTTSFPAQMVDVAPTVLHHFNMEQPEGAGVALQRFDQAGERETVFYTSISPQAHIPHRYMWRFVRDDGRWSFDRSVPVRD